MTAKALLLKAAKAGEVEGSVLIQEALNTAEDRRKSLRELVLAVREFLDENDEFRDDAPPEVVAYLTSLRQSLLGSS